MIVLYAGRTTGPQVARIVRQALEHRTKKTGRRATRSDFAKASGISRMTLYEYANGQRPTTDSLLKIADGLMAWGIKARVLWL